MFLRSSRQHVAKSLLLVLLALVPASLVSRTEADDVAAWLESRGFNRLLAEHYEEQFEDAKSDERVEMATRLARLYAQLLMDSRDSDERTWLEARGMQLLKGIPPGEAEDLRVELLNGRYMVAEDTAERYRLRLTDAEDVDHAVESLDSIIEELQRIIVRTSKSFESSTRKMNRSSSSRSAPRRERLNQQQQVLRRAEYLLAWSLAYRGWLKQDADSVEKAESLFAKLLDLKAGELDPDHVSLDRRAEDAVSWSILGMAFCRGMSRSTTTAMRWFDLLEVRQVPSSVSSLVPAWRLAVLLDEMDHERVGLLLDDLEARNEVVPTTWWRLVAVHGLEQQAGTTGRLLADRAIAALASRNALDHLYDLVDRYGDSLSSDDGFALAYARGVLKYKEAQDASGEEDAPLNEEARRAYREAGVLLERAMEEEDRDRWSRAIAGCSALLGWCRWNTEQFSAARDAFLFASNQGDPSLAEGHFWMAIVCEDRLAGDDGSSESAERLSSLTAEYIKRWPDGSRTGELMVRSVADVEPSMEAVEQLGNVQPGDPAHADAQRRSAQILYALFTDEASKQQKEAGERYLVVALPLLMADADIAATDSNAAGRCIARARRILEVALDSQLQRLVAAESAFRAVKDRAGFPLEPLQGFEEELKLRHLQMSLFQDDTDRAETIGLELVDADPDGLWTRLASRSLFREALKRWKAGEGVAQRDRVAAWGRRILDEHEDLAVALASPGMVTVASNVAAAGLETWNETNEDSLARATCDLYGRLLDLHPRNQQFLRGRGTLSREIGEQVESMRCWRVLLAGTTPGSDLWFESKTNHAELLAETEPDRSLQVLLQHRVLYPEWGPSPWGGRLASLHRSLAGGGDAP